MPGAAEVQPISAEIASTQNALVAARDGSLRAPLLGRATAGAYGHSSPRPGDTTRRPDSAWLALEERVAAQVATLHQKHNAEQLDAERVLRASVTRLESRVRALEGQGVRSDRRVAEIQGLVQALTEEQRALLIRLDRLEESFRGTRQRESSTGVSDDWHRRLNRLEREHRAMALNVRLIVSVTEEAQQRQQQRVRYVEEYLQIPPWSPGAIMSSGGCSVGSSATTAPKTQRAELSAAELPFSQNLEAAQHLLRRCEAGQSGCRGAAAAGITSSVNNIDLGFVALRKHLESKGAEDEPCGTITSARGPGTLPQHNAEAQIAELGLRVHDLSNGLLPRVATLETSARGMRDIVAELRAKVGSQFAPSASQQPGEEHAAAVSPQALMDVQRRLEAQQIQISEFRSELTLLPSQEQVAAICCKHRFRDVEDLRSKVESFDQSLAKRALCSEAQVETKIAEVCTAHAAAHARDLEKVQSKFEDQLAGTSVSLQQLVQSAIKRVDAQAGAIDALRLQVDTAVHTIDLETTKRADSAADAVQRLREKVDKLAMAPATHDVSDLRRDCTSAISELNVKFDNVARAVNLLQQYSDELRIEKDRDTDISLQAHAAHLKQEFGAIRQGRLEWRRRVGNQDRVATSSLERPATVLALSSPAKAAAQGQLEQHLSIGKSAHDAGPALRKPQQHQEPCAMTAFADVVPTIADEEAEWTDADVEGNALHRAQSSRVVVEQEFADHLQELRGRCDALQDVIDKQLVVAMWDIDRQLPEAMEKVERLLGEHAERMGKTEEHEVRLNLVLTKLSVAEDKVQVCIDRFERIPTPHQLRGMWREDFCKKLQDVDMEGLQRKVEVQGKTLDEIGDRFQELCDRLVCCPNPTLSGAETQVSAYCCGESNIELGATSHADCP